MSVDTPVTLTGRLICTDAAEAETVRQHLRGHIALSRAEAGCVNFEVSADGPLVWQVREQFSSPADFLAHQERTAASDWGRATARIRREYRVTGMPG